MLTPKRIDSKVRLLLEKLGESGNPFYVPVRVEPFAVLNECPSAVEEKIRRSGGSIVFGWEIAQTPIFTEAQFHAIWKSPKGEMVDITLKTIPEEEILFVKSAINRFVEGQVDNVRINNTGSAIAEHLIQVLESLFLMRNKGERALQHKIVFGGEEANILAYLEMMKHHLEVFFYAGGTPEGPCFCGRDLPYCRCHGEDLANAFSRLKSLYSSNSSSSVNESRT